MMKSTPRMLLILLALCPAFAWAKEKPNVIVIMADDLGAEGLNCYGNTIYTTPHLDKMAAEGARFNNAYSTPLCTPTRVMIMSGLYPNRTGYTALIGKSAGTRLSASIRTFGHDFKAAGYKTAIAGKWQLGKFDEHPNQPVEHGFVSLLPQPTGGALCVWLDGRAGGEVAAQARLNRVPHACVAAFRGPGAGFGVGVAGSARRGRGGGGILRRGRPRRRGLRISTWATGWVEAGGDGIVHAGVSRRRERRGCGGGRPRRRADGEEVTLRISRLRHARAAGGALQQRGGHVSRSRHSALGGPERAGPGDPQAQLGALAEEGLLEAGEVGAVEAEIARGSGSSHGWGEILSRGRPRHRGLSILLGPAALGRADGIAAAQAGLTRVPHACGEAFQRPCAGAHAARLNLERGGVPHTA